MKYYVLSTILLLAMSIEFANASDSYYGSWTVSDGQTDPFQPDYFGHAQAVAKQNSKVRRGFLVAAQCTAKFPEKLYIFFAAGYTHFRDWDIDNGHIYAHISVVFDESKPRTFKVWYPSGDESAWYIDRQVDKHWLESGMRSSQRMYVQWDQYDEGFVLVEINLAGTKDAFAELKRRCSNPPK